MQTWQSTQLWYIIVIVVLPTDPKEPSCASISTRDFSKETTIHFAWPHCQKPTNSNTVSHVVMLRRICEDSQRRNWVERILPNSMLLFFLQNDFPRMLILTFFINSHFIFIPKHFIDMNYLLSFDFYGTWPFLYLIVSQWESWLALYYCGYWGFPDKSSPLQPLRHSILRHIHIEH